MLLADVDLAHAVATGHLGVTPFQPGSVQPASIDLTLDSRFRVFAGHWYEAIDPDGDQAALTFSVQIRADGQFVLQPGQLVLGATAEKITLPADLAARVEGKSTLGRLGLQTHSTAGWIDPGFTGQVTLELHNVAQVAIKLRPGMAIGQLCVFQTASPSARPYGHPSLGSRYQGQDGPQPARRKPAGNPGGSPLP